MVYVAGARDDWRALSVGLRRKRPTILLRPSGERVMGERGPGAGLHSQTVGRIEGCLWFCEQGDHQSPVHKGRRTYSPCSRGCVVAACLFSWSDMVDQGHAKGTGRIGLILLCI